MGTHEELMKRRGLYYDLVESQLAGKEDTEEADEAVEDLPEEVSKINRPMSRKLSRQGWKSVLSRVIGGAIRAVRNPSNSGSLS